MKPRELAYCGVLGAAALLLPVLFHLLHVGRVFLPMYLPLITLAFFVRPGAAAWTAGLVPLLSGALTGMPPFYPPIAPVMAIELALTSALIGGLRRTVPCLPVWAVLALALAVGRTVSAGLLYGAALTMKLPAAFVTGISVISGWPGVVLMLVVVPQIVRQAEKNRTCKGAW